MSKQRKACAMTRNPSVSCRVKSVVQSDAEQLLLWLRDLTHDITALETEASAEMAAVTERYNGLLTPLRDEQTARAKELIALMKKNRAVLFDGTDVVNLPPGSLIRNKADHVTIPKTALAECKAQHFDDVIKIVESLDREAIEKWPDAKLVLIGATRKPKEEFSYNLKNGES